MIKLWSKYKIILLPILLIVVCFLFTLNNHSKESLNDKENLIWETSEKPFVIDGAVKADIEEIVKQVPIYICGQVNKPGVYYTYANSIVNEVIELAGGFSSEADKEQLNLARQIKSHEKIYVPKIGEQIDKRGNSYENVEDAQGLIDINQATDAQLDTLPGIGMTRAKQIIEYRENNGPFFVLEDIKNVPGIGDKIFESLKEFITIE